MSQSPCYVINLEVMTVLNADLKLTNSICERVILLSRRVSTECSAVETGILCAPISGVRKLVWVQSGWEAVVQVCQDQSLEALHNDGCEYYRAVVIHARRVEVFLSWNYGVGFEACW